MQFCPFRKKFALQFIDVHESSSVHFLLQNTPNTIQLDLGRVSLVATNQACFETNYGALLRHDIVELFQQNV